MRTKMGHLYTWKLFYVWHWPTHLGCGNQKHTGHNKKAYLIYTILLRCVIAITPIYSRPIPESVISGIFIKLMPTATAHYERLQMLKYISANCNCLL